MRTDDERLFPTQTLTDVAEHNAFGRLGEDEAALYQTSIGYTLLERNWRYGHEEIDLIADDFGEVVFVEVKTRQGCLFGAPAQAVDAHKRKKIILTATQYLRQRRLGDCFCRFDVIEVYAMPAAPWRVRHYEGAFEM